MVTRIVSPVSCTQEGFFSSERHPAAIAWFKSSHRRDDASTITYKKKNEQSDLLELCTWSQLHPALQRSLALSLVCFVFPEEALPGTCRSRHSGVLMCYPYSGTADISGSLDYVCVLEILSLLER